MPPPCRRQRRHLSAANADTVVEIVRRQLGAPQYREALRHVLRPRRYPETGRTYTPTQELVARWNLKRVITTNNDPGIIDARAAARPGISVSGYASYTNSDTLERRDSDDIETDDVELPILFAHGRHDEPDHVVLATTEYRRAYQGRLRHSSTSPRPQSKVTRGHRTPSWSSSPK